MPFDNLGYVGEIKVPGQRKPVAVHRVTSRAKAGDGNLRQKSGRLLLLEVDQAHACATQAASDATTKCPASVYNSLRAKFDATEKYLTEAESNLGLPVHFALLRLVTSYATMIDSAEEAYETAKRRGIVEAERPKVPSRLMNGGKSCKELMDYHASEVIARLGAGENIVFRFADRGGMDLELSTYMRRDHITEALETLTKNGSRDLARALFRSVQRTVYPHIEDQASLRALRGDPAEQGHRSFIPRR